ncbi:aspartyl/glutamyl-tRNA(Asn/Gln) amidotransferase subunit C [Bordetella genomosp. 9]|uniref:Aspartyl/glutamyl-tRNA(Asn/Gln) amidotransferase subunit C n=1 Tax=Bordetella genomosp. 9 TaxID=1416803 RepID=A0A261R6L0_9BORD|nr:Asp-tRNA(Asn)/Glu-tRNA(Gln) amidotransferase subunit GatC [Bordetella genomosp. 9]OZI20646.1 aspartyl/glutamyl-tRNA(Asn/Gln) amidotransferase subunit C [Bordetella genomosp. 9]
MALNEEDVARIARLARIELTPERRAHALQELNGMLHIIERLQQEDTAGVEPMAHPLSALDEVELRLREDKVTESGSEAERVALMSNAPEAQAGLFLVPKVLE